MKNQLVVIDVSIGKQRVTSGTGEVISYGTITPFELVELKDINGEGFAFHYNGQGYDEENANYQFVESDDLLEWTPTSEIFEPTNDPLNQSISFITRKKYQGLELVFKNEATVGVMKGVLQKL